MPHMDKPHSARQRSAPAEAATAEARPAADRDQKKAAADLMVLALLEERDRHGYEIAKQIEARSAGAIAFHVASLYTLLHRLEGKELVAGRWVEKSGQRRRRYYRLTPRGVSVLAAERRRWQVFANAVGQVAFSHG